MIDCVGNFIFHYHMECNTVEWSYINIYIKHESKLPKLVCCIWLLNNNDDETDIDGTKVGNYHY